MSFSKSKSGLCLGDFAKVIDNKKVALYTLKNSGGSELTVTNFGAKIVTLLVPDREGKLVDIVLGLPNMADYRNAKEPYFGGICGRTANRIAHGEFVLEGKKYSLAQNNGANSLHGGVKGFNAVVWEVLEKSDKHIKMYYLSPDGEEGYPGNLEVWLTYSFTDKNELMIDYSAKTDKTTIVNLTNHSFFNLSGEGDANIGDHLLQLNADYYFPTDEGAIPLGHLESVKNTPFDFTKLRSIGERIDEDNEQLKIGRGYDHCFVLNKASENEYSYVGYCQSPKTGIRMDMFTSEPGVQIYTGNWLDGSYVAKAGHRYPARSAVCFEMQHYPDAINQKDFPSIILRPNETFESKTAYKFTT